MKKQFLALFMSAGFLVSTLGGFCAAADTAGETLFGQVTAISGSSVTLALAEDTMPQMDGQQGKPPQPQGEPDGTEGTIGQEPPERPSTPPQEGEGQIPGITLTGETKTFTISDDTVLAVGRMGQDADGALSDITVGSILRVIITDGEVTAVEIQNGSPNGPRNDEPKGAQGIAAAVSAATVKVNGSVVNFQAYTIGGNNYFKLRDIAQALSGTEKGFEVGYDSASNAVTLTSGGIYTTVGGELAFSEETGNKSAILSSAVVYLDGTKISLTAYVIDGNNYFKLRDLADALDFGVLWDSASSTVGIDTATGYTE